MPRKLLIGNCIAKVLVKTGLERIGFEDRAHHQTGSLSTSTTYNGIIDKQAGFQ